MVHNICQSQRAGMALGMGVRELPGSVLGLMTGAKLLQVGLCYTGSRDYLVHRECTLGWSPVQVYSHRERAFQGSGSGQLPAPDCDVTVTLSPTVHVTRHAPSHPDLVTILRIVPRIAREKYAI